MKSFQVEGKNKSEFEARSKYMAANKSTIFDSKPQENTRDLYVKMKREKYGNNFEPKFKEITTSTRRSLHNGGEVVEEVKSKRTSSTFGYFKKEMAVKDEGVEKPSQLGDPWKRKLADLNPKLAEEDIHKVANLEGTNTFYARRSLMNSGVANSHKDAKVKELQSNIFNDIVR
jgi:hypothetical protein